MFKKNSENAQSRSRRSVIENRVNQSGIDPNVFRSSVDERTELIKRKRHLESKVSYLKLRIGDAHARLNGFKPGSPTDKSTFQRWCHDRDAGVNEIRRIDVRLLEIRANNRKDEQAYDREKELRFERVFMRLAKEMLAEPIYERLLVATIHRMKDTEEETKIANVQIGES